MNLASLVYSVKGVIIKLEIDYYFNQVNNFMEKIFADCAAGKMCQVPAEVFNVTLLTAFIGLSLIFFILVIWSLVWKGVALWHAAKANHKWWFIVMLVVNTAGLLEIIYYFFFSKRKKG